ncbi:MAG: MFS transporter [Hyphomicrobiales bacterium]|nr:MFS transporter [Hyphomicrobiales bacterium]
MRGFWLVVAAGAGVLAINMGVRQTFGLYVAPISADLGVGREAVGLAIAILNLAWGAAAPFAGGFVDAYGAGRVILGGAALYAGGLLLMAGAQGEAALMLSGALIGLGVAGTGFSAVLGVVGRAAPIDQRQLALSLATMGSAIGQFVALPFAHALMDAHGWALSLVALAALVAAMAPLGSGLSTAPMARDADAQSFQEALSEAARHRGFWLLTGGFFVCGFHIAFVAVHLPGYLAQQGFSAHMGVAALMIVALANIAGTYLCGRAGDVIEKRLALTLLYGARALIFVAFVFAPPTQVSVIVFAALLGLLWLGTIPLTSGMLATFFGPRWLSMLYGVVFFSHQVGSFLGAWLGGRAFDALGSYTAMWWVCAGLGVLAALLNWPIREEPSPRLAAQAGATP